MCNRRSVCPDRPVILTGDLNVAHRDIDYHNPHDARMRKQAGTTLEEQDSFQKNYATPGLIDTFRAAFPEKKLYSYFSPRSPFSYSRKEGLRIDYVLVGSLSESYLQGLRSPGLPKPYILDEIWSPFSDHCPIGAFIPLRQTK